MTREDPVAALSAFGRAAYSEFVIAGVGRVDDHDDPIAELRRVYKAAHAASDGFSEDSKERIFD